MLFYRSEHSDLVKQLQAKGWKNSTIQKYIMYLDKRLSLVKTGRTSLHKDVGRSRLYKAEWAFQAEYRHQIQKFKTIKQAQWYADRVTESKTWEKICDDRLKRRIAVTEGGFRGKTAGVAYGRRIKLCPKYGFDQYTLLHELAHCAGHMHHDVSFRKALLTLVSRFMGRQAAAALKHHFKQHGVKLTSKARPLTPDAWLARVHRLEAAREKKQSAA